MRKNGFCEVDLLNRSPQTAFISTLATAESVDGKLFTCNTLIDATYLKSSEYYSTAAYLSDAITRRLDSIILFTEEALNATYAELIDKRSDRIINMSCRFFISAVLILGKKDKRLFLSHFAGGGNLRFAPNTVDGVLEDCHFSFLSVKWQGND